MKAQLTRKWHQKKRFILPTLVFFPPLDIPLILLSPWSRNAKIGATIVSGLLMMGALADSSQAATQSASNSAPIASSTAFPQPSRQKSGTIYQEVTKSEASPDANTQANTKATLIDDDPKSKINLQAAPSGAKGSIRRDFVRVAGKQPASSTQSESQATSSLTMPSQSPLVLPESLPIEDPEKIPEPSSVVGILTLGALGVGSLLRNKI
jgi:hypothetical protein